MSYDLLVFNPSAAPKSEEAFLVWFNKQAEWSEDHSYDNVQVATPELRNLFLDIIIDFPALNGPHVPLDINDRVDNGDENLTDYCIGKDVVYCGFAWSLANVAYFKMLQLSEKHKVGFYNPSGDGNILFPDKLGRLESINKFSKPWWKIW